MELRAMRLMVMFDLPTTSPEDRRRYSQFRKFLINDGYFMMQYSVYARTTRNHDDAKKHMARLQKNLPSEGAVRCLLITEKQYAKMKILVGDRSDVEKMLTPIEIIEL